MRVQHREWSIHSLPDHRGHYWYAWVEVEREPMEEEGHGPDLPLLRRCVLRYEAAYDRGVACAKA